MVNTPTRPSKALLRAAENYIRIEARKRWCANPRTKTTYELSEIAGSVIKFLGIAVHFTPYEGNFLLRDDESAEVYVDQDVILRYSHDYIVQNSVVQQGDKYYSSTCFSNFRRYNPANNLMVNTRALRWEVSELVACPRCSIIHEKSESVYSDVMELYVDKVCHRKLLTFENVRPDLSQAIGGYHSHKQGWLFIPRKVKNEASMPMGVELEIHPTEAGGKNAAMRAAQKMMLTHTDNNYYFEWDGSLQDGGFEMVTNPFTLEFHHKWWEPVLKTLRTVAVGYNVEQHIRKQELGAAELNAVQVDGCELAPFDYGIHITVHRKHVPDGVVTKLVKFFDDKKNQPFLWAIAQRCKMYGGWTLGSSDRPTAHRTLKFKDKKVAGGQDRRQPVNVKGNSFLEFRMFRSTLNTVSFIKNLEFIDAIVSYFKSLPGIKTDHRNFILWLTKPENAKRYPNLMLYLQHPLYFVKGGGKVKNTWLDLFTAAKIVVKDPLTKEYGPKLVYLDTNDIIEGSMI